MLAIPIAIAVLLSEFNPDSLDISAWKANARALTDGKGHFIVYDAERPYDTMFYGDQKKLTQLRIYSGGRTGTESWSAHLWEPRIPNVDGNVVEVEMKDSGKAYSVTCGKRTTALTELTPDETARLIAGASFVPPTWDRQPERLLRDDRGNYYLVDRLRTNDRLDRRDFRLFVGPRGKMKQVPLKDIVDDSEGMIFSTKSGELRLVFGNAGPTDGQPAKSDFRWIEGKKSQPLTDVPLDAPVNARLIYLDLGPYLGARLGTPCDDLM
ncbi:MAG: hypothetical protein AB1730_18570 [Myxococcota bacterium]|jgi:hypothetical protein